MPGFLFFFFLCNLLLTIRKAFFNSLKCQIIQYWRYHLSVLYNFTQNKKGNAACQQEMAHFEPWFKGLYSLDCLIYIRKDLEHPLNRKCLGICISGRISDILSSSYGRALICEEQCWGIQSSGLRIGNC